ncbi:hypothetical protein G2W53_035152 [Senna tora]|uniref:Uncharacterized protein n=1 Tax=Senna tora TaxID=362788 RepID=A0A834T329_9FABA|nr:hypothetical protein G2W53_035152 [Senna tora]
MGRSKRLRIFQSESQAAAPAQAQTPSSFLGPTITITPVLAPSPSQSTEPPPETTQHFTSSPTSTPIPDELSKQCNRYWTIDIIDEQGVFRQGRLKVLEVWSLPLGQRVVVPFNAQAQPVWEVVGLLSGFLGLVVTDVATFPISYHSWDKVPNSYKESCFISIKELASGKPVSRGAVFVATHKRKDGSYVNGNAKIDSLRNYQYVLLIVLLKKCMRLGYDTMIPLNGGSDPAGDVALQEIARLKSELEANKSQTKSFMTFVLRNLGLESVPPEFADLINPQVSDANSAESSSTGHQSSQA